MEGERPRAAERAGRIQKVGAIPSHSWARVRDDSPEVRLLEAEHGRVARLVAPGAGERQTGHAAFDVVAILRTYRAWDPGRHNFLACWDAEEVGAHGELVGKEGAEVDSTAGWRPPRQAGEAAVV